MQTRRNILHRVLAGAFALALIFGGLAWSAPIQAQSTASEITADEAAALEFMREEEKLARDVYLTLDETWHLRVFQNISRAEQTHMDAVATLLDRYGIEDPAAGNAIGLFTDPDLQDLYDQLIDDGSRSMADALRVGVAIEEIDILDLEARMAQTSNADILRVYGNLLRGSGNHLRAFVSNLERQTGETYDPQYLDQAAYEKIMAAGNENGNGGNRSGNSEGRWGRGQRGNGGRR